MSTERIPSILAQALLSLDGRFTTDCEEENGCAVVRGDLKSSPVVPQGSTFSMVSQINGGSTPISNQKISLWNNPIPASVKNSVAEKANPSNPDLPNNPDSEDALEGFRRGFRFFYPAPQPKDHLDI